MGNKKKDTDRVAREKDGLRTALITQMALIRNSCKSYDEGFEESAIDIATRLRVLLHDTNSSHSLLGQLNLKSKKFYDTAGDLNPKNLLPQHPMLALSFNNNVWTYAPICKTGSPKAIKTKNFIDWWRDPIIKDSQGKTMSREKLIGHVVNTDGGAHIDPTLDPDYHGLSRGSSMEFLRLSDENGPLSISNRIERALLRQIAYETIMTIERHAPYTAGI